ncbi:MAG: sensor domain-containing diguanylate cyclase [Pseudomonadota bacterium]
MSQNNELLACYKVLSMLETASDNTETMLDNMPGVVVVLNQNLQVIRANQEFVKLSGRDMETVLGFKFVNLFSSENADILQRQFALLKNGRQFNKRIDFELEITLADEKKTTRQFYWQASLVSFKKGAEGDLISISGKDLSELYQSEMKLKNIFSNLPLGMLMIDEKGKVKEVLSQFSEVLFDRNELVGLSFSKLVEEAENGADRFIVEGLSNLSNCFGQSKNNYDNVEKTFPKKIAITDSHSTHTKWLSINYQPILKLNRIDGFILLIEDVTETEQAKKEIERVSVLERQILTVYEAAIRDPLSGLYTRLFMKDSVKSLIGNFHRDSIEELAVLMMDIDHFKSINDTYGHKVGDTVISEIGRIILKCVRETDIAIRYGGEEFLIILPSNMSNMTSARIVAERIREDVANYKLTLASGEEVAVTISGGAASCGKGENIDLVIERADGYLYQAKRSGRNRIITEGDSEAAK